MTHLYGEEHHLNKRYNDEEFDRRKREHKKKELRNMLDKYVATDNHNQMIAFGINQAQTANKALSEKVNETDEEMRRLMQECKFGFLIFEIFTFI